MKLYYSTTSGHSWMPLQIHPLGPATAKLSSVQSTWLYEENIELPMNVVLSLKLLVM